jgi:hypothetical protein
MLYCPIPWIHQAIRNNGDVRVCCQANQGPDNGLLRKPNGDVYNAKFDDLDECRNAQKLKDIRVAMLNDKWHPECIRCEREVKSGMRARFIYEKDVWNHHILQKTVKSLTEPDGTINVNDIPIVYYDLRFGNLCNLKCRMCGPTDSSSWYSDYYNLWGNKYHDTAGEMTIIKTGNKYTVENDIYKWYESQSFWNYIYKNIPNIKLVQIVGGEPMLIKQHFDFLEKCVEVGHAKDIKIEHNSNIVYIPEKAWDLWKHFKEIRIGASIDGVGKINDYIRYPSKWENVEANLRRFDEAEANIRIWIAATIQIFNILHLPDMMQWKIDQNFKRVNNNRNNPIITTHPVHGPDFLNIKALPLKVKKVITEKFERYEFSKFHREGQKILQEYQRFMMQEDLSYRLGTFWRQTNGLDAMRNQNIQEDIPELYELIGDTNV